MLGVRRWGNAFQSSDWSDWFTPRSDMAKLVTWQTLNKTYEFMLSTPMKRLRCYEAVPAVVLQLKLQLRTLG